jgi:hypothetical protein
MKMVGSAAKRLSVEDPEEWRAIRPSGAARVAG